MRDIKFRAWDITNKQMLNNYVYWEDRGNYQACNVVTPTTCRIIDVMQYTGLKDKNGKEIYESDIVKVPDNYDEFGMSAGETYGVYFAFGGFRLKPKYSSKQKGFWLEDDCTFEVIGNIYENPELMEDK